MNKVDHPEINVSELTAELRKAMRRGTQSNTDSLINAADQRSENHSTQAQSLSTDQLPTREYTKLLGRFELPQPTFQPVDKNNFHVNELLVFNDAAFVSVAYRALLQREPDPHGSNYYLRQLRAGFLDKIDVIAGIRFSPEGRRQGVRVRGLAVPSLIRRVRSLPVIGYLFGLGLDTLRLPVLLHRVQAQQAHLLYQDQKIAEHISLANEVIAGSLANLSTALTKLSNALAENSQASEGARVRQAEENQATLDLIRQLQTQAEQNVADLSQLKQTELSGREEARRLIETLFEASREQSAMITEIKLTSAANQTANQKETEDLDRRIQQMRADLAGQTRQTETLLAEARRRLPHPFNDQQLRSIATQESHQLDSLYADLEDQFRGSREDIKHRLAIYLERIKPAVTGRDSSIIDLGCGRGEWLELLKDEGLKAVGIDTNRIFLESCRQRKLEVVESDAVDYLRGLPANSIDAITGFHIVEHLPMDTLVNLLDEIVRVLSPDGMVVFETPNPENVLVGSNFFYFDPTHRNPIPSSLMKFLLEARGFHQVEVLKLNPWDDARLSGDNELTARINDLFYGPMDYAIMGWKVSE